MEYSIKELSQLAGVSARTLRYYDEIGLLKPVRLTDAGYRFYGQKEVDILQQILFYRERGLDLRTIQKIIYEENFNMLTAMEVHLLVLEHQKANTENLIATVKKTIQHMKGEIQMSNKEKFEALKEQTIRENEKKYGEEARKKYGDEQVDIANRKLSNLSEAQWLRWKELDEEILHRLELAVNKELSVDEEEVKEIVLFHKEWLTLSGLQYSAEVHKGIATMYIADERFTEYYDRKIEGCAKFLYEAVQYWA